MSLNQRKKGFSFGLASGIITTLGMIVGLHSGTHSKMVVLGGILVIAIADALSDSLGVHISEETENHHTAKEIWEATIYTFLTKFIVALTFILPFLFFSLQTGIWVSIFWGLSIIVLFSYYMATQNKNEKPYKVVLEHLIIAIAVVIITHFVGDLANKLV